MESVPERSPEWYTEGERDRLLVGIFEMFPQWYAFFYLTTRLGLRAGEVYAVARSRIRDVPPQLIVDRAVQRGNKSRPAMLGPRKNNKALTLALTEDVADAIRWHIRQRYSGAEFLFSKDGTAHLGQRAQLRLVADLEPSAPPHVNVRSTSGKG
jgi:hypothetical protein